ncbi:hypothetical protein EDC19_0207 [Natranaerovirga hydrolytica]|uniref:Uncharacterized protein n=1 Tax=Natranaerovirga hydrolytica TaxID=680378 RepID=A0A4R1MXH7_9FIRM|nr:hypothetical protein [Natranaerovirga hydrolytica]TCK97805.1 hypothetical protein EDC19_0207 [Natranaerovirga hydrolytica]
MKGSKILFGSVFILLGVYIILNNIIEINLGRGILPIILSIILFGIYFKTKEKWLSTLGAFFLALGILQVIPNIPIIGNYLEDSILYLIIGILFLYYYHSRKKSVNLILGAILLWIGVGRVVASIPNLDEISWGISLVSLGLAFVTIYFVRLRQWTLIPAGVLIVLGVLDIINYYYDFRHGDMNITTVLLALLLIFFGISMIFDKNKSVNDENDAYEDEVVMDVEEEKENQ